MSTMNGTGFGTVVRVSAQDSDSLNVLQKLGLKPGVSVEVVEVVGSGVRVVVAGESDRVPSEWAREVWWKETAEQCWRPLR